MDILTCKDRVRLLGIDSYCGLGLGFLDELDVEISGEAIVDDEWGEEVDEGEIVYSLLVS